MDHFPLYSELRKIDPHSERFALFLAPLPTSVMHLIQPTQISLVETPCECNIVARLNRTSHADNTHASQESQGTHAASLEQARGRWHYTNPLQGH